jgi:ligand-binding SRPBCC domain-containing protein
MNLHTLHRTQKLPISIEQAWQFFSDPRNLAVITPPWLNLIPVSDVPDRIYPGMIIVYRIRPFPGMAVKWVTEITHVHRPGCFVDEQRFGPYKLWHHQHHFREIGGGTEIEDLIHYALPLGILGRMTHALTVRRQLDRIFEYRRQSLSRMFTKPD